MKSRWLIRAAGIVGVLIAFSFALAWVRVDADRVARAMLDEVARLSGQPAAYQAAELDLLPVPVVRVQDVRIGGDGEPPRVRAASVRLRVSLVGLLLGQTALRSVELDSPSVRLDLDPETGWPVLPPGWGARASDEGAEEGPLLAITSLDIRNGRAELGPLVLEGVEVSGGGRLDLSAALAFEARVPGIGRIQDGKVELEDLVRGPVRWSVRADLEDVDLAELRARLAPDRSLWGRASGVVEFSGVAREVADVGVDLAFRPLDWRGEGGSVVGDVTLRARTGDAIEVDLTDAEVEHEPLLRKPLGAPARATGRLRAGLPLREVDELRVRIGEDELEGEARLVQDPPGLARLELRGPLDLAPLAEWWTTSAVPTQGRVRIDGLTYTPQVGLLGSLFAESVLLPVDDEHSVTLDGPLAFDGSAVQASGLAVGFAGQTFQVSGSYGLDSQTVDLTAEAAGVELSSLLEATYGKSLASGRLYAQARVSGPLRLDGVVGRGRFEVPGGGEFAGLSAERFLRGQASTSVTTFRRLSGEFEIRNSALEFSRITLEQGAAQVALDGALSLEDGAADMQGTARVDLGSEVIDQPVRVTGTADRLRAQALTDPDEEGRKVEQAMLEGILQFIDQRGEPDDPALAREFRAQRDRILRELDRRRRLDERRATGSPELDDVGSGGVR